MTDSRQLVTIDNISIDQIWEVGKPLSTRPFGQGHINDTYLVDTGTDKCILQRVNKRVFHTRHLVSNYELLVKQAAVYRETYGSRITPEIHPTLKGSFHHIDADHAAWRLVEFIADATSYDISPDPGIAYKAAKAIGEYQLLMNGIEPHSLGDTISGFHDLPARKIKFDEILASSDAAVALQAAREIRQVQQLAFIVDETITALKHLKGRITHNDTKLNNVLFSDDRCYVIDLDTVMRGYVIFDYGDMVRSFTSPAAEDEPDLSMTVFREDHFEALTNGYLEVLGDDLTPAEKEHLLTGALAIIYEQAIRFLTDHLAGNIYYKTSYPGQNLDRTRTQLKLLSHIVQERDRLNRLVRHFAKK